MKSLILIAFLFVGFGAISDAEARSSSEVTVGVGQTKTFSPTKIRIKLVEVIEDSRCPEGVECIWAGNAKLKVVLSKNGKRVRTVEINTNGGNESVVYEGYKIAVTRLTPKPVANEPAPDKKLYIATFSAQKGGN
jgi:hypothetical protein